jgi:peptide subunit release factor 1 (eRF1)
MASYKTLLQPRAEGVLSLYVPFDPADTTRRGFEARGTNAIHDARRHLYPGLSAEALHAAEAHVKQHLANLQEPIGRTAVLVAAPDGLLVVEETALRIPLLGRFAPYAWLAPLILADAAEPRGLAVLVDDAQALIVAVIRDRAGGVDRLQDLVPGRQRQGGWSQAGYARHREQHVLEHNQHVAAESARLLLEGGFPWLAIGGHPEACAALERELPKTVQDRIAGHFNAQFFHPPDEIERLAHPVILAAQERKDAADLEAIMDASAKGGPGAVGWGPVLTALAEGAVHELFCPAEPARLPASRDHAGHLSAVAVGKPSWSSGEATERPAELPDDAIHVAVLQGAAVRAVTGAAARRLEALGGVAARLRHT